MVLTIYTCECGEPVEDWSPDRGCRPPWKTCPKCGKHATSKGVGQDGMNAGTGELVSDNAGCGVGQEVQGNKDLADANVDAYYRESDGALVSANRQAQNEAIATRGLMNRDDGGFGTPKMARIRERSLRGNPRRS